MTTIQPNYEPALTFDFRKSIEENRLKGLWKMMVDYRLPYIGATAALAISALAKTFTYMLLRYFADDVLTQGKYIGNSLTGTFVWIAAGFDGGVADRARALHWDGSALTEYRDFFEVAGLVDDGLTSLLLTAGCSRTVSDAWLVGNVSGKLVEQGISFHFDGEEWRAHPVFEPRDVVCLETDTWFRRARSGC